MNLNYRPDIDGLRAIAILLVLIFHFYPSALPGGFIGVDIFFCISGFLISRIILSDLKAQKFSVLSFYRRRAHRIFPAMFTVVTCTLIAGRHLLFREELVSLGKHTAAGVTFILNAVLHEEMSYFSALSNAQPLLHLWSLSIEEQFYLFWPPLLLLLRKWGWLNLGVLSLLTSMSFVGNFFITDTNTQFYAPWLRFWEFSMGGCIACMYLKNDFFASFNSDTKNLASYLGILGVAFGVFVSADSGHLQHLNVLPAISGVALLLLAGSQTLISTYLLSNPILRRIGWISYSLYLWHWPLLIFAKMTDFDSPGAKPILLITAFLAATLTYLGIERPFLKSKFNRSWITLLLVFYGMALATAGFYIFKGEGKMARASLESFNQTLDFGPSPVSSSCTFLTQTETNPEDWCDEGNALDRDPSVLVIGDSFSRAYGDMLRHFASAHPDLDLVYRSLARGRCPSLMDYGPPYCQEIVKKIYEYIAKTPSVHTVIIAEFWRMYADGVRYPEGGWTETRHGFARALKRSIEFIEGHGKRVVVFWTHPRGRKPQFCVNRWSDFSIHEGCSVSLQTAQSVDTKSRDLLMSFFEKRQITVFDPFKVLCDKEKCVVLDGNKSIYGYDGHHLSSYGAKYLLEHAQDQIIPLLLPPVRPSATD